MIVTVEQFNTFTGNMETAADIVTMKESMLQSAQEIVSEYLGYEVENCEHDDYLSPIGQSVLYLNAYPVTSILDLSLFGSDIPSSDYAVRGRGLRLNNGVWPVGTDIVHCRYMAGWTSGTVPAEVCQTIIQIASLLLQESGGNIGITGKSMSENSRTYVNYTNFTKWLEKLDAFRVVRFV